MNPAEPTPATSAPKVRAASPDESALPRTDDQRTLRAATRAYARKKFNGPSRFVETPALGGLVEITRIGIEKATSHAPMTRVQFLSVTVADDLLRSATLRLSAPDREGRPNVRLIHTLDSRVLIGRKVYPVKVTVREMTDGRRYYDQHTLIKAETPAGDAGIDGSRRSTIRPSAGAPTDIIGATGPEVKPATAERKPQT